MRLGGFYGFTAPMLLMSFNSDMKNIMQTFNVSLNNITAIELKKELYHFRKSVRNITPEIIVTDDCLLENSNRATVNEGELVGSFRELPNYEEVYNEIFYCLCDQCAKKLYEKLINCDAKLDVSALEDSETFLNQLRFYVKESMKSKTFSLTNLGSLLRSFMKNFAAEAPNGDFQLVRQNIRDYCLVQEKLPSEFYVSDRVIKLTVDEMKMLEFFKNNENTLEEIWNSIELIGYSDETIFGVSFVDFLNRKPTCLYYMVANQFDHLKNSDIRLFPNILKKVTEEFEHCKSLIKSRLLLEDVSVSTIDVEQLESNFPTADSEVLDFLRTIFYDLDMEEIAISDLDKLQKLFSMTKYLDIDGINHILETNFDNESLQIAIEKFNLLGLGGINLFTHELFLESTKEVIFTNGSKIHKSEEYLQELDQICSDIDALISTFKPIGGDLDV